MLHRRAVLGDAFLMVGYAVTSLHQVGAGVGQGLAGPHVLNQAHLGGDW